jgi:CheY-like chemotaxis protein
MPDGGRLALAVRSARGAAGVPAAVLEVTDTGVGMDETVQARAFEPFFTTKEAGKGTGLGLANVRHVVEEAGGTIALRSAPGAGTTFALTFPAVAPVSAAPSTTGPGAARPGARILVVDDDIRVRALIVTALGDAGHRVEEAGHVDAALRVVEQAQGLDLLVTDLVMPGPPVTRLLAAFRARFPGAAVIACSAYSDDPEVRRSVFVGELALLAKPFERAELLAAVQAALRDATRLSATV